MDFLHTVASLIVTLGILVTIHEWGHFWVARRCGVKVLRFSVGFGKALWSRRGKDGTEYVVAAIPLGGYVKMLDEREGEVPEALKSQAFNRKSVYQRFAIVAAGPLVNLIFAVIAYWAMFLSGVSTVAPIIGGVDSASIAARAGVPVSAEIVSIDGRDTRSWQEVNLALAAHVGESKQLDLGVKTSASAEPRNYVLSLENWHVDLENESPLAAVGISPYRPVVKPQFARVVDGGSASLAGIRAGDLVVAVDGQPVQEWAAFVEIIKASAGKPLSFLVLRDGRELDIVVTPASHRRDDGVTVGLIGAEVQLPEWPQEMQRELRYGPVDAVAEAVGKTWSMITLTLDSIWKMIEGVISVKNLSGPITIAKVAGASAASGLEDFISFLAYLSISLGVLNLLPIPVLDGGHLVYYLVEMVTGKPVSERVQVMGFKIGAAILFSLMSLALINDFMRL